MAAAREIPMAASRSIPLLVPAGCATLATAAAFVFLNLRNNQPVSDVGPPYRRLTSQLRRPEPAAERSRSDGKDPAVWIGQCSAAGDVIGLQTAVSDWFYRDPVAVRDWLASQDSLKSLQLVLVQIARDVSAAGSPADALKWAQLLEDGPDRDQTLFEIYAAGRRYHSLTEEEIRSAPFPPKQIEDLLSGAADD